MDTKYEVGYYTSQKTFKVLKKITTQLVKEDKSRVVRRAFGTWAGQKDAYLEFAPNTKTYINEEDIKLPSVINLIAKGIISRTI